jgi:hypothetical protein
MVCFSQLRYRTFQEHSDSGKTGNPIALESYNTFNHPEFDGVNSNATFAADGTETDTTFGQINDSNGPRVLQLAVRINF